MRLTAALPLAASAVVTRTTVLLPLAKATAPRTPVVPVGKLSPATQLPLCSVQRWIPPAGGVRSSATYRRSLPTNENWYGTGPAAPVKPGSRFAPWGPAIGALPGPIENTPAKSVLSDEQNSLALTIKHARTASGAFGAMTPLPNTWAPLAVPKFTYQAPPELVLPSPKAQMSVPLVDVAPRRLSVMNAVLVTP